MSSRAGRGDDAGLALAVTTAAASILGNIAQAIERTDLKRQARALARERDRLVELLGQWQRAHADLRERLAKALRELGVVQKRAADGAAELDRKRGEIVTLGTENARIQRENANLRRKLGELEAGARGKEASVG